MSSLERYNWPVEHEATDLDSENLRKVLEGPSWTHGRMAREFEEQFSEWLGVKHSILVPNGTAAISLSLLSMGLAAGQEVIIPGLTWPSVVSAIVHAGGIPVYVDVEPGSLCMTPEFVERAITERTAFILATHLYGSQCDLIGLQSVAERHKLVLLEDVAQSIGSSTAGRPCGTFGVAGAFSLNQKKVLACGEGGIIATNSDELWHEIERQHLIDPERNARGLRMPGTFKVSEFQAAVALAQFQSFDAKLAKIERGGQILRAKLNELGVVSPQSLPENCTRQSYYNFAFHSPKPVGRAAIEERFLSEANVSVRQPYRPLNLVSDINDNDREDSSILPAEKSDDLKNARVAYEWRTFRIPFTCLLADDDRIEQLGEFVSKVFEEELRVT